MSRIGISGHANLTAATAVLVAEGIRKTLDKHADLVGVTCLARGADQVFAQVVLDLGGRLEVVLPAADYRDRKVKPDNRAQFDALINAADKVITLDYLESGREAYMAASERLLSSVDELVAVWDGGPSGGYGGTADVVDAAKQHGLPATVVWPDGAERG